MPMPTFATVDEYLASISEPGRSTLQTMRRYIKAAAPHAEETLSYGIPCYKHEGVLVNRGGAKKHVALYGIGSNLMHQYADELKPYLSGDSTVRMPLDAPMPEALVTKLVKARIAENEARTAKKRR
jgi:uncharacterized protein YdhG (YjbR/CyaY superfamily)